MRKLYFYLIIFILILFVLPVLFTKTSKKLVSSDEASSAEAQSQDNKKEEFEKYDYSKCSTIKLYHTETKKTEEVALDDYLCNAISAEMPVSYDIEALKAQAIVSRTYTLYQIVNGGGKHGKVADICDNFGCCQAWISKEDRLAKWKESDRNSNWEKITKAVGSTSGKVITYDNKLIDAFFHSNSGGKTENVADVWGGSNFPYLQSVETSGESDYKDYSSNVSILKKDLLSKLKKEHNDVKIDFNKKDEIKILDYTEGGRVKTVKFGNIEIAGTEVRKILELRSTNFTIKIDKDNVIFDVVGYGHGVGMSQTGANSMAKSGKNCEDIIKHFYTDVEIKYLNEL